MCEHFSARADEPFALAELWDLSQRLEHYGIAGFGWGTAWVTGAGTLATHRDARAFRDDPVREELGRVTTIAALVHLRRPSKLSPVSLADTQPFADPAGRFAFSHNGELRDHRAYRPAYATQGRLHGRADTEVGARWLEDAWAASAKRWPIARRAARPAARHVRWAGEPRAPASRRVGVALRRQR
jgi:predicted glutamine amidotransferase